MLKDEIFNLLFKKYVKLKSSELIILYYKNINIIL